MFDIIAIDPGLTGAIVLGTSDGFIRVVKKMPDNPLDLFSLLRDMRHLNPAVIVEDVGHTMPGNSAKSAYTFAVHRGHLEMALIALEFPAINWVQPTKWLRKLGFPAKLERSERKQLVHEFVLKRYPNCGYYKFASDAIAIYAYYLTMLREVAKKEVMRIEETETKQ